MMIMLLVAGALSGPAQPVPAARVYEKVRSDGVTVVCVRHVKKPTVFTSRTECKPAADWRVARELGPQANSPGGTYTTDSAFSIPRAMPRLVGH